MLSDTGVVAARSAAGDTLHLNHGPIDLIITAAGPRAAIEEAFRLAEAGLRPVLCELVSELAELRRPASDNPQVFGPVARRMVTSTSGHGDLFVTPMAAVAGAVADHILALASAVDLERLTINNGGDIAFALAGGQRTTIGVASPAGVRRLAGTVTIDSSLPVRGVATSGWRGRSLSLGIADAVTVFAANSAEADAAASLIASAVDLPGHPRITRRAAHELDEASDLGGRLVTTAVGALDDDERRTALDAGKAVAERLLASGRIVAALLVLGSQWLSVEQLPVFGLRGRLVLEQ